MQDDENSLIPANLKPWGDDLACPVCFRALRFSKSTVVCTGCGRNYPVIDGIPVLIPQRAVCPSDQ